MMEQVSDPAGKKKLQVSIHLVLCVFCGSVFYILVNMYVRKFTHSDNEEISLAATVFFLDPKSCSSPR